MKTFISPFFVSVCGPVFARRRSWGVVPLVCAWDWPLGVQWHPDCSCPCVSLWRPRVHADRSPLECEWEGGSGASVPGSGPVDSAVLEPGEEAHLDPPCSPKHLQRRVVLPPLA